MPNLSLSLLGAFEFTVDGEAVTTFRTDKIRALLGYLAVEADRPHKRQTLAGLLWPEWPDEVSLGNLRKSLHRLRETIERAAPGYCHLLLAISPQTVQLHSSRLDLDVARFSSLVAACDAHVHRQLHLCEACMARFGQAIELYRADMLEGFALPDASAFDEWLVVKREGLHQQAIAAMSVLAEAHLLRHEAEPARGLAQRQVGMDPWREEAHRQLMRALVMAGRRSEALEQFEVCRLALSAELGVAPQPETVALYERILGGADAGYDENGPDERSKRDSSGPRLHQLPAQFTPFVGRSTELHVLEELLLDPDSRLITLIGPGGVGKTRLGIEAVRRLANRFAGLGHDLGSHGTLVVDDIYFIALAGVAETTLLPSILAAALGLTFREREDPAEQLVACLSARRCLLVLDNVEHLAGAEALVRRMLEGAPSIRLLVTSRRPLNLRAERLLSLEGLRFPPRSASASESLDYTAVQMFLETARHALPSLTLTAEDEAAAVRISRLVEGWPLALELAASWLRYTSCAAIAAQIEADLGYLATPAGDMPERHRSMEAVFIHSWALLSAPEREVLARASLFHGSFSLEAALAVTGATIAHVATLIDHSLVRRTDDGQYQLHELTRQFAARRLDELTSDGQVAGDAARRYAEYYIHHLEGSEAALFGREPQVGMASVERVIANVRQAWESAVENGWHPLMAAGLTSLARYYVLSGLFHDGAGVFGRAAAATQEWAAQPDRPVEERRALDALSVELITSRCAMLGSAGQLDIALGEAQTALGLADELQLPRHQARVRHELGSLLLAMGDYEQARQRQREAIDLATESGDQRLMSDARKRMAIIHFRTGTPALALPLLEDVLQRAEALGDTVMIAGAHGNLAVCHIMLGDLDQALAQNKAALRAAQDMGVKAEEATQLGNMGLLRSHAGDDSGAMSCFRQALALDEALGNRTSVGRHLANIGHLYRRQNEPALALDYYDRALALLQQSGARSFLLSLLIDKAEALFNLGQFRRARKVNDEGLAHMIALGHQDHVVQGRILAARIDDALGQRTAAAKALHELIEEVEDADQRAAVHFELWRLGLGDAHGREAAAFYRQQPFHDYKLRLAQIEAAGVEAGAGSDPVEPTPGAG